MTAREQRLAENERTARGFNAYKRDAAKQLQTSDADRLVRFVCECSDAGCIELVRLRPDEYRAVRCDPRRFFVVPGHETPGIEHVVEITDRYCVVEKAPAFS